MSYFNEAWQRAVTPPDQREIWEWFSEEGELPSAYAKSGKFEIDSAPMLKGPLRALRNPLVRHVVVMSGIQCLKTLIGEMWMLWLVLNDPGPTQWLQTTNEEAKDHAKERFLPLIEAFPAVHRYYGESRHDRTTCFIKFKHMYLRMEGSETRSNLQRKSIKNQFRSEIWQARYWPPGTLKEADSRLTQFTHNSKKYTESQPGWDEEFQIDDMHATYKTGNQNRWEVQCQGCGLRQPFYWSYFRPDGTRAAMRWDTTERTVRQTNSTDPNERYRWNELRQTVRYECIDPRCGHRHYDDALVRRRLASSGEHVPQNPDADLETESFNWGQLAMPNLPWFKTEIGGVYNFLLANDAARRGNDKKLREFWMKVPAEPYNPGKHGTFRQMETIEVRTDQSDPAQDLVVEGITFTHRIMGVDVQMDHYWLLIEIWSAAGDSLTLWAEKVYSWDEVADRQKRFHVRDEDVGVDISHRTQEVIEQCTRHGHWETHKGRKYWVCWKAWRGADQQHFIWIPRTGATKGQRIQLPYSWPAEGGDPCRGLPANDPKRGEFRGKRCAILSWSNPWIKDVVIARRDGRAKGIKSLTAQGPWNEEFSRQMHSQKKQYVTGKYGSGKWKWVEFRDPHLFDCKCMISVRADQRRLLGTPSPTEASSNEGSEAPSID